MFPHPSICQGENIPSTYQPFHTSNKFPEPHRLQALLKIHHLHNSIYKTIKAAEKAVTAQDNKPPKHKAIFPAVYIISYNYEIL